MRDLSLSDPRQRRLLPIVPAWWFSDWMARFVQVGPQLWPQ